MAGAYTELRAWKQAVELVVEVYRSTLNFPKSELYGLTNQIRRSAVSVPSNIAEGKGRSTDREFALFLCHARGSLLELETQLFLASKLGYLNADQAGKLESSTEQLAKTLNALLNAVRGERAGDGRSPKGEALQAAG
jgi:four helix bundle protein